MNVNESTATLLVVALAAGGLIGFLAGSLHGQKIQPSSGMGEIQSSMSNELVGITSSLEGRSGNDFDKAFLQGMIVHHEGALNMAEAGVRNGSHPEIQALAREIIQNEKPEKDQMEEWLKQWFK